MDTQTREGLWGIIWGTRGVMQADEHEHLTSNKDEKRKDGHSKW